jgi:hypothetical protein
MSRHAVALYMLHGGTEKDREYRQALADLLPDADVSEPDDVGVFEIAFEAEDQEAALTRVFDAMASAGADDHLVFMEHPDLPQHWRARAGGPRA